MVNNEVYLGYAILFAAVIGGRFISEGALRKLSAEQKAAVLDEFAGLRRYNLVILAGLVFLAIRWPETALATLPSYLLGAAAFTFRKLKRMSVPPEYAMAQLISTSLTLVGLVGFIALWVLPGWVSA